MDGKENYLFKYDSENHSIFYDVILPDGTGICYIELTSLIEY